MILTPGLTALELAERLGGTSEQAVSFALLAAHTRFRRSPGASGRELGKWWPARQTRAAVRAAPADSPGSGTLELYPWQADALAAWARAGRRGVVEAVTGTGKTRVGVAAVLAEIAARGQALILVPTVELQHQWVAELQARLADRPPARPVLIGRLGAGSSDSLASHDVLVAVVNSARSIDARPIRRGGLLVADECHRYGSDANRLALDERFTRRLGLSATYAREDDGNLTWLEPYFGGTCFRLGYHRALADAVTARFTVTLLAVRFTAEERAVYQELSDLMGALRSRLIGEYGLPAESFELFLQALSRLADSEGEGARTARNYRLAMLERRRLLADTPAKDAAVAALAPAVRDAQRTIVFTLSIAAAERASRVLSGQGLRAASVHSGMARADRRQLLAHFAAGDLDVLSAPRVLDEGVDVPTADLAVIAGASRSRRQMIQRVGRVLRRKPDGRRARFAVLFVEETVEDPAFGAHEAFLEEIVPLSDGVSLFPAGALSERAGDVRQALRPSWPPG